MDFSENPLAHLFYLRGSPFQYCLTKTALYLNYLGLLNISEKYEIIPVASPSYVVAPQKLVSQNKMFLSTFVCEIGLW